MTKTSPQHFEKYFLSIRRTILAQWEQRVEQFIAVDPGTTEARNALAMFYDFVLKGLMEDLMNHVHTAYGSAKCVWSQNTEATFSLIYLVNVNNKEIHLCFTPIDRNNFGFVVVEAHDKIPAPTTVAYPIATGNDKGDEAFVRTLIKKLDDIIFK